MGTSGATFESHPFLRTSHLLNTCSRKSPGVRAGAEVAGAD